VEVLQEARVILEKSKSVLYGKCLHELSGNLWQLERYAEGLPVRMESLQYVNEFSTENVAIMELR